MATTSNLGQARDRNVPRVRRLGKVRGPVHRQELPRVLSLVCAQPNIGVFLISCARNLHPRSSSAAVCCPPRPVSAADRGRELVRMPRFAAFPFPPHYGRLILAASTWARTTTPQTPSTAPTSIPAVKAAPIETQNRAGERGGVVSISSLHGASAGIEHLLCHALGERLDDLDRCGPCRPAAKGRQSG